VSWLIPCRLVCRVFVSFVVCSSRLSCVRLVCRGSSRLSCVSFRLYSYEYLVLEYLYCLEYRTRYKYCNGTRRMVPLDYSSTSTVPVPGTVQTKSVGTLKGFVVWSHPCFSCTKLKIKTAKKTTASITTTIKLTSTKKRYFQVHHWEINLMVACFPKQDSFKLS
jgi:hypothetical protein